MKITETECVIKYCDFVKFTQDVSTICWQNRRECSMLLDFHMNWTLSFMSACNAICVSLRFVYVKRQQDFSWMYWNIVNFFFVSNKYNTYEVNSRTALCWKLKRKKNLNYFAIYFFSFTFGLNQRKIHTLFEFLS